MRFYYIKFNKQFAKIKIYFAKGRPANPCHPHFNNFFFKKVQNNFQKKSKYFFAISKPLFTFDVKNQLLTLKSQYLLPANLSK